MSFWDFFKRGEKKLPLVAEAVRFAYSEKEVLKDVTLNIREGTITAIIGESGSGKSTFLKLVAGIIAQRYGGRIRIFGKPKVLEKHAIGFVPQELSIIPDLSILDNIKIIGLNLGISENNAIKKAYELMKLLRFEESLAKKPTELSGGQKVRLNIILSLLHDPKVVILDEPFVGLDFLNRRLLWHFLESLKKKGHSVILTSHLLTETQEHADRLVILKNGKIFFNGTLESLKEKLQIKFVFEVRFSRLSAENFIKLKKFCDFKDIKILDRYERYLMFALRSQVTRDILVRLFDKLSLHYEITGLREPNLDEIFLKA
ncbi:MAG: ABC transporter ATP-binding protein [Candidatus Pacearchaeota archaeon]